MKTLNRASYFWTQPLYCTIQARVESRPFGTAHGTESCCLLLDSTSAIAQSKRELSSGIRYRG
jgi:hypothetical protein